MRFRLKGKTYSMKDIFLFDIDGTLYSHRFHEIDSGLLDELQALREEGSEMFLVSSRSPYEMVHLPGHFMEFPFNGMVLEGGAAIYDENKRLIDARLISNDNVKAIRNFCEEHQLLWRYSGPDGNYFNTKEPVNVHTHWRQLYLVTPEVKPWKGDDVCNIIIWTDSDRIRQGIRELLPESSMVVYPKCVEIRSKDVSKEAVVGRLRDRHPGCQIYAFGDGMNDIEMLKLADYGLATANAADPVKEAADEVIGSVHDNGVSSWLKARRMRAQR